jgi:hypothetical protein
MKNAINYRLKSIALMVLIFCFSAAILPAQNIRYVKPTASGSGNGSSWANASADLQAMINASAFGDTIWVAAGTYKPTRDPFGNTAPTDPRDKTFYLKNGVQLYGGFNGTESDLSERDVATNVTILSGDIGTVGNTADNCYHVVLSVNDGPWTGIDGFTVREGNADAGGSITVESYNVPKNWGGGMCNLNHASPTISFCLFTDNFASSAGGGMTNFDFSSPHVSNCTFSNNSTFDGGGMYNYYDSSPNIDHCVFSNNSATGHGAGVCNSRPSAPILTKCTFVSNSGQFGGGLYNDTGSSPTVSDCIFSLNSSNTHGGGMLNSISVTPTIINCLFYSNTANYGGGMGNIISSSPSLINCTFYANIASSQGGGMYNESGSSPAIKNCIIWGNTGGGTQGIANSGSTPTVTFSIVQGGYSGTGNSSTDPLFFNPSDPDGPDNIHRTADDGLGLQCGSPAINAGTSTGAPSTDITGFTRSGSPDIGAYEFDCSAFTTRIYVTPNGSGKGSSWADATNNLQSAINNYCGITEIWVAAGTCKPTQDPFGNTAPTDPRNKTFYLKNGVKLYGGFDGTESNLSERDVAINVTILSGDIGTVGNTADNCYHVVLSVHDGTGTVLDGFTVSGGNANNGTEAITVESYPVYKRDGGGMDNSYSSTPTITNCIFSNNAALFGGGLFTSNSSPNVTNCVFRNNTGEYNGAAIHNFSSSAPVFTNCTFFSNAAGGYAGGIWNTSSSPTLINCTLYSNSAVNSGGAMYTSGGSPIITNCIIWGNTGGGASGIDGDGALISYSIVQGGYSGTGNSSANPLFINPSDPDGPDNILRTADDGLGLQINSPAIDAGTPSGAPALDITGYARTGNPDMGAYEYEIPLPVELLYFSGQSDDAGNHLYWATASEKDNAGFELERSGNHADFETIGRLNGAGDSQGLQRYAFLDEQPLSNVNYYRLKQLESSGAFVYSNIVCLKSGTEPALKAYPNPGDGLFYIAGKALEDQPVRLFNLLGQSFEAIVRNHEIDLRGFPVGVYFLQLAGEIGCLRLVKE